VKPADVRFIAGATTLDQVPKDRRAQVALIGPSNVGKSSLLNALVGRKGIARTSKTPGRTQQLNFFLVEERFHLVDLPGYGFADVPRKAQDAFLRLVESYLSQSEQLRLLLLLLDCRREPSERDLELLEWLAGNDVPHAIVLTKCDKLSRSQLGQREKAIAQALAAAFGSSPSLLPVSAQTGAGCKELWGRIIEAVR
jgi:GTP-binding protein